MVSLGSVARQEKMGQLVNQVKRGKMAQMAQAEDLVYWVPWEQRASRAE
jgi:hypothetical protein